MYGLIMQLRNKCFDAGLLREMTYDVPVVGVGNLAVGGTGKTPCVEYLLRLLEGRRVAVLSRGYGRVTRGFRRVETDSQPSEVGDEPLQIKQGFPAASVCVCESRRVGMSHLLCDEPAPEVVLLDDNLQHRYVKAGLQLLLTDFARPYSSDCVMPWGRLREWKRGAKRADVILVTKCPPQLSREEAEGIRHRLKLLPHQRVFFTTLSYGPLRPFSTVSAASPAPCRALMLTAIAKPAPLEAHLRAQGYDLQPMHFPDHHRFSTADMERIAEAAEGADIVITTEKDAVRLHEMEAHLADAVRSKLHVQALRAEFLFGEAPVFSEIVTTFVNGKH